MTNDFEKIDPVDTDPIVEETPVELQADTPPPEPESPAPPPPGEPVLPVVVPPVRFRTTGFRILIMFYFIAVLVSGYLYWVRPVRTEHVTKAIEWWTDIAEVYELPIPDGERYR